MVDLTIFLEFQQRKHDTYVEQKVSNNLIRFLEKKPTGYVPK